MDLPSLPRSKKDCAGAHAQNGERVALIVNRRL
jgi:hypothetical protein